MVFLQLKFNIGKVDLLIGGSPCQSFSNVAGIHATVNGLDGKSKYSVSASKI